MDLSSFGRSSRIGAAVVALGALVVVDRAAATQADGCTPFVVTVDWDQRRAEKVSGVVVRVRYPASLDMPSSGTPDSSKDRVALVGGTSGGLFDAVPRDSDGDGRKDVLSIGLITQGIPAGPFARVRFDCVPGTAPANASELSCVSDVADDSGSVPSSCTIALAAG